MGKIQGIIHAEANSNCESVRPIKLCASKIQLWDRYRIDIPSPRGKHYIISLEDNPVWLSVLSSRSTGVAKSPNGSV